jgi:hypothetical protein
MYWGTVADWLVAAGTLVVAVVAVFQETIRGWFYRPVFRVSTKTEPPDCVAVPFTRRDGTFLSIYAQELRMKHADDRWKPVASFPPMNLNARSQSSRVRPGPMLATQPSAR